MTRPQSRTLVASLVVVLGVPALAIGCHLADDPEPKKCEPGSHFDNGRCLQDQNVGEKITIELVAGTCTVTPPEVRVGIDAPFSFQNDDTAEHVVSGPDGKVWVTAPAKGKSPLIGITRAGSYGYTVSGCAATGTVIVQ